MAKKATAQFLDNYQTTTMSLEKHHFIGNCGHLLMIKHGDEDVSKRNFRLTTKELLHLRHLIKTVFLEENT